MMSSDINLMKKQNLLKSKGFKIPQDRDKQLNKDSKVYIAGHNGMVGSLV